jgi:hypothetical protein
VVEQFERDPALQATTLFALLCAQHPERYRPTQVRTLQRQIPRWKALQEPEQEVIFEQVQVPGERAPSDFPPLEELGITLAGVPFPHLVSHCVLTCSNVEAVSLCFSETVEALAEGLEKAVWQMAGVPQQHRTAHFSAAIRRLNRQQQEDVSTRYAARMAHDSMQPTWNTGEKLTRTVTLRKRITACKRHWIRLYVCVAVAISLIAPRMSALCKSWCDSGITACRSASSASKPPCVRSRRSLWLPVENCVSQ